MSLWVNENGTLKNITSGDLGCSFNYLGTAELNTTGSTVFMLPKIWDNYYAFIFILGVNIDNDDSHAFFNTVSALSVHYLNNNISTNNRNIFFMLKSTRGTSAVFSTSCFKIQLQFDNETVLKDRLSIGVQISNSVNYVDGEVLIFGIEKA